MITKRRLVVPIFDYKVTIMIFDEWSEMKNYVSDSDKTARGITVVTDGAALLAVKSDSEGTIAHECVHLKNAIWIYIGYTPQVDNDEVDAYLVTYLYDEVKEVFDKHNNKTTS